MRRKAASLLAALAVGAALLSACRGSPLPEGMEEEALLDAGREVMAWLVAGEYQTVHDALRSDVAETVSADDLQALALRQLDGAGVYKQVDSAMVTGQSSGGEAYGVAVLYCDFTKKDVLFRLAFDPEMRLIGLEIQRQ